MSENLLPDDEALLRLLDPEYAPTCDEAPKRATKNWITNGAVELRQRAAALHARVALVVRQLRDGRLLHDAARAKALVAAAAALAQARAMEALADLLDRDDP